MTVVRINGCGHFVSSCGVYAILELQIARTIGVTTFFDFPRKAVACTVGFELEYVVCTGIVVRIVGIFGTYGGNKVVKVFIVRQIGHGKVKADIFAGFGWVAVRITDVVIIVIAGLGAGCECEVRVC